MIKNSIAFIFLITLAIVDGRAQCSMYELPLSLKVENSSDLFEGEVISKQCFWNADHNLIFTSNTIEVYKVFKGTISVHQVDVITEGGVIGNEKHEIIPNITFEVGYIGLFLTGPINDTSFQCFGASQGFIKYNLTTHSATVPFHTYNDIKNDLYVAITSHTGESYRTIKSCVVDEEKTYPSILKAGGSITSFSPNPITGGTNSVLTINGSGFGAIQGTSYVGFTNANDGGLTYMEPLTYHYVSWSDTEIQVMVPAKTAAGGSAGTGTIEVVVGSTPIISASPLTISYTETNTTGTIPYQTSLVTINATGGITWQMFTGFDANTAAKDAFTRAMETWTIATQVNWVVGTTTGNDIIVRDSVNVVRFDIASELPAGTLARCYYYWLGCSPSAGAPASEWFVSELDMAIDDGTNWEYGPALPAATEYDLESVLLHELGHGHQLAHVIAVADPLHFSVVSGVNKRSLSAGNIAGGTDVMSRSFVKTVCGYSPMTPLVITSINEEENIIENDLISVYPNPTTGAIVVESMGDINPEQILIYNSLGNTVETEIQQVSAGKCKLNLLNTSNGIYSLVIYVGGETITKKIVLIND